MFKEKQRAELAGAQAELAAARAQLAQAARAYEEHIRALTAELWSVGEKFLRQKDEAEWLRRKQRSGSLMSLQHVHSVRTRHAAGQTLRGLRRGERITRNVSVSAFTYVDACSSR